MKNSIRLIFVLLLMSVCGSVWAAGSCSYDVREAPRGNKGIEVIATCATGSGVATFPTGTSSYLMEYSEKYIGMYLFQIAAYYHASSPVSDDTDLKLAEHTANGYDILYGAGENRLDNSSNNDFNPWVDGGNSIMPILGPLYIDISGNTNNDAIQVIVFKFIRLE